MPNAKTAVLLVVLGAALSPRAEPDARAFPLGEGLQKKSDGLFLLEAGGAAGRLLIEQAWDGDARIWRFTGGAWKAETLYEGLGQCFSPLVYDFEGQGNYSVFIGSWNRRAGIHEIPLTRDGRPSGAPRILPGSAACGQILCLRAADGRGDGVQRLYVASEGNGGGLYEFTLGDNGWSSARLHEGRMGEFAVGDGRGDGIRRIYAGDRGGGGELYEFAWGPGGWQKKAIPLPAKNVRAVALGDGRGDGKPRLYVNAGRECFEVEFRGGAWRSMKVGQPGARYYITPARSSRGEARVYSSMQGVGVFKWVWNGKSYEETPVDGVTSATGQAVVGDGRGDGVRRLYISNGDRQNTGAAIWETIAP